MKKKNTTAIFTSENQGWITPDVILQALGTIACDPCTWPDNPTKALTFFTEADDGLNQAWASTGINYCNPPYNKYQIRWIMKGISEYVKGKEVYFLIPARTDTKIWQQWVMPLATNICFIKGRLSFIDPDTRKSRKHKATFPAAVVYFGRDSQGFKNKFSHLGFIK